MPRSPGGDEPRAGLPSGHIPGSVNIPSAKLVAPDGRMADEIQLKKLFDDYRAGPVVATCGSGVSAAVLALGLAQLGNWEAALYDGSWTEWASDKDNPVETSTA